LEKIENQFEVTSTNTISVEKTNVDGVFSAKVSKTIDGKEENAEFTGTEAEVDAQIKAFSTKS
jgi:K(+)-stimulated pyrophosphate-energized sodium pump